MFVTIRDFLNLLKAVKGPSASGDYEARCPAHDDKTASLSVKEGEKGIVIKCHAGCRNQDIVDTLGITMRDLFYDDVERPPPKNTQRKPKGPLPKEEPQPKERKKRELGKLTRVYDYTDEEGKLLFQVCRFENNEGKTFLQRVPDREQRDGYRYTTAGVRKPLYRLPNVLAAIVSETPILIVEGEKDADNLEAMGYVATTNPGGASKEGGPKWTQEHYDTLRGADVYVIPDIDQVGLRDRRHLALKLRDYARSVRFIDLRKVSDSLPDKGDVTDLIEQLGQEAAKGVLDELMATTPLYTPDDRETVSIAYNEVGGYGVSGGCICQESDNEPRKLCNFVAAPLAILTKDDGVTITKDFIFTGWTQDGRQLPEINVPATKYPSMTWVLESWDFSANIMPGSTTKDKLRYVISCVGDRIARREIMYQHTGWRKINGEWAYLYQGGAIGAKGVTVDLGSGLTRYRLTADEAEEMAPDDAVVMSMSLRYCMSPRIAVPLLAMMYLAPLRHFLEEYGNAPAFSLFLLGGTGTRKSTAVALALSHFGHFTSRSLPASFGDTSNYVRKKAFLLKDMPIVVDDYHPVSSAQERRRMDATAQSLSRAFGDGAERGRMKADLTLQESNPPRGVAILSGEDMPNVGESGSARYFVVQVKKDDVPANEVLTDMQDKAAKGVLRKAMRGYIQWLTPQADELGGKLHRRWLALRAEAMSRSGGQHGRAPEAIAHMILAYEMMLEYFVSTGAMDKDGSDANLQEAWRIVTETAEAQGREMSDERPARMFLSAINELLSTKAAQVVDMTKIDAPFPVKGMIGYRDEEMYYLLPEVSYKEVAEMYVRQGLAFPLTRKGLYRQMKEDGLLLPDAAGQRTTKLKMIQGKGMRLLWVPRVYIDGTVEPEQVSMRDLEKGFAPVDDKENPF